PHPRPRGDPHRNLRVAALVDAGLLSGDHGRPAAPTEGTFRNQTARGRRMSNHMNSHMNNGLTNQVRGIPRQHLVAGVCLLALLVSPVINPWQPYPQGVMLLGFLLAIQASSWNIISGYAGYISMGHSS